MRLLNLLIFVILYMLAVAVISSIFNPGLYAVDPYTGYIPGLPHAPAQTGGILDNLAWGWQFMTFIGAGLTMDIPGIPDLVRGMMLMPMYGALAYFIYCNIPFLSGRKEG
jgi:hypothetical protein